MSVVVVSVSVRVSIFYLVKGTVFLEWFDSVHLIRTTTLFCKHDCCCNGCDDDHGEQREHDCHPLLPQHHGPGTKDD